MHDGDEMVVLGSSVLHAASITLLFQVSSIVGNVLFLSIGKSLLPLFAKRTAFQTNHQGFYLALCLQGSGAGVQYADLPVALPQPERYMSISLFFHTFFLIS